MTDADVVRKLRKLDRLLEEVHKICLEIEASDHPNALAIFRALNSECVVYAWPTHVAATVLAHPERWEIGEFGIRLRKSAP